MWYGVLYLFCFSSRRLTKQPAMSDSACDSHGIILADSPSHIFEMAASYSIMDKQWARWYFWLHDSTIKSKIFHSLLSLLSCRWWEKKKRKEKTKQNEMRSSSSGSNWMWTLCVCRSCFFYSEFRIIFFFPNSIFGCDEKSSQTRCYITTTQTHTHDEGGGTGARGPPRNVHTHGKRGGEKVFSSLLRPPSPSFPERSVLLS